jgi:three-Cys-motif partner protein
LASIETPSDVEHRFGGRWTELKLDAVEYYLRFYTQALKDKPTPSTRFILWYIDAFAGTGDRVVEQIVGGLLDGIPVGTETVRKAGSAARALAIDPPFENFVFIERDPAHCAALERLKAQNPQREISCIEGDANKVIPAMFSQPPWGGNRSWQKRPHRAVVFLDPYDVIEWKTLTALAHSKAVDLWFLFPIGSVLRQAANDFSAVDSHKAAYLDKAFGSTDWREKLYSTTGQGTLWADQQPTPHRCSRTGVEEYMKTRLETIFAYVSPPLPLLTSSGAQLFSLYFAVANPSSIAIAVAKHCVKDLLKKYGKPASRHTSGR